MPSYFDLLKSPHWQKKRLEILEAADFLCEECRDGESTLHVHHTYYGKGRKPWEYEDCFFQVLCEKCHQKISLIDDTFHQNFYALIKEPEKYELMGYLRAKMIVKTNIYMDFYPQNVHELNGFGNYFWMDCNAIIEKLRKDKNNKIFLPFRAFISLIPPDHYLKNGIVKYAGRNEK